MPAPTPALPPATQAAVQALLRYIEAHTIQSPLATRAFQRLIGDLIAAVHDDVSSGLKPVTPVELPAWRGYSSSDVHTGVAGALSGWSQVDSSWSQVDDDLS